MTAGVQEIIALLIVAGAVLYLVQRAFGWPRLRSKRGAVKPVPAQLGDRLARGLARSKAKRAADPTPRRNG